MDLLNAIGPVDTLLASIVLLMFSWEPAPKLVVSITVMVVVGC